MLLNNNFNPQILDMLNDLLINNDNKGTIAYDELLNKYIFQKRISKMGS